MVIFAPDFRIYPTVRNFAVCKLETVFGLPGFIFCSFMKFSRTAEGIFLGIVSAVFYGMNPLFALPLYEEGMNPDSVLFYRYGFAVVLLAVMLKLQRQPLALERSEVLPLVVMGILFSASSLFLYISFLYMDAGLACTILFVYPIIVALIMFVFFHERLSFVGIFCILLALTGILLLYRGDGTISSGGVLLVLLSSLSYAVYIVGVNKSSLKRMHTGKLTMYVLLFGMSIFVVRLVFFAEFQLVPSVGAGIRLFSMAFLPTIVSLVCMTAAVHRIGSTVTAVLGALEPVTALIIGITLFDEVVTPRITVGVIFVIGAVTLIIIGDQVTVAVKLGTRSVCRFFAGKGR